MKRPACFILLVGLYFSVSAQLRVDSIAIDGEYRVFRFYEPTEDTEKSQLIFILHGSGGNGERMMKPAENLQGIAAAEKLLLVYPDGYKRYWNECRKLANNEANKKDVDEQAFFRGMLQYFSQKYRAIANRFFAIGLSGGGHMSYKLAMTMPDTCRAISVVVANLPDTMNLDCRESKQPVGVMITNSTSDNVNPFDGGKMTIDGTNWGEVRSSHRPFYYWAGLAGYKGSPRTFLLPDTDTTNNQTITQYAFSSRRKPPVILLQVNGGVHSFPKDIDIFLESWKFFKREVERRQ